MQKTTSYLVGVEAEQKAAQYLQDFGWSIIKNRYKSPFGEIDLLACKDDVLVACEIKFRKHYADAVQSISIKQQKRILDAFQHFLSMHEQWAKQYIFYRFDAIILCADGEIFHIENAWQIDW